jgi:NCS1 family nucleobase:cation symporter-1
MVLLVPSYTFPSQSLFELRSGTTSPTSLFVRDVFLLCFGLVFRVLVVHNVLLSCSLPSGHRMRILQITCQRVRVSQRKEWSGKFLPDKRCVFAVTDFPSYFLFWIIQLPLLLIPPTHLRYLFATKLIAAPITALATMGWCVHKAGGSGQIFALKATVSGSTKAYLWLSCMSSVTGSWSTLACNIPDFSRYARSSKGQYIQLPLLPIIFTLCAVIGIVTTSATGVIYGTLYWNPLDIISKWLEMGHGGRAAAFFAATSWYVAQVGTNITANSISAANDLTVLFPRYINIKRGCVLAAIIGGWVIVPWKILSSAETFLNFMGGYAVFLAPIAGILCADYWLVHKQHIDVPALYDPLGRYNYFHGWNWRALLTMLISVCPNLPGLAHSINNNAKITNGAMNLYTFDWLFGFTTSIFLYTALSYFFKHNESQIPTTIYGHDLGEVQSGDEETGVHGVQYEKDFGNVDAVDLHNPHRDEKHLVI